MKRILIAMFLIGIAVPFCQAQDTEVRVSADENTDFSQYKTYYWSSALNDKSDDQALSIDNETVAHLKEVITKKMEAMGYTLQENNPDLLVNFYTLTKDTSRTTDKPEFPDLGYSYWWGPDWYDRGDYWNGWDFWVNGSTYWFYGNPTFQSGTGADAKTQNVQPGTLFIDVIDNEKNMLVWEGYIPDGQTQTTSDAMEEDVEALLQEFPSSKDQG